MMFVLGLVSAQLVASEMDHTILLQNKKVRNHADADDLAESDFSCWRKPLSEKRCCWYNRRYPGDVLGDDGTPACEGLTVLQCASVMNENVEIAREFADAGNEFDGSFELNGDSQIGQLLGPLLSSFNFASGEPLVLPANAEVRVGQLPDAPVQTFYWKVTIDPIPGNDTAAFEIAKKVIFEKTAENFDPTFIDQQELGGLPSSFSTDGLDQDNLPQLKFRRLDASPLLAKRELLYLSVRTNTVDSAGQEVALSTVPSVSNDWIGCKYAAGEEPHIQNDFGPLDFNNPQVRSINLSPSLDRITKLHNNGATIEHVYTTKVGVVDFLPKELLQGATLQAYADEAIVVALEAECLVNKTVGEACTIE